METIALPMIALPIAVDHPAFAGHFPGAPVVPGVVLLDETLQAICSASGIDLSACRIDQVKFLSPVKPGEAVTLQYRMQDQVCRFELFCGDRRVATGVVRALDRASEGA